MKLQDIDDILVGGLVIEVNTPTADLINNGLLGHYLPAQLEIGIRQDLPLQLQANVLTHELIHSIANVYCEGLNLNEAQVAGIAQGMYQVLTDNPDVVKFITMRGPDNDERDMDTVMNNHVRTKGDDIAHDLAMAQVNGHVSLGHEYDRLGIDQGGH